MFLRITAESRENRGKTEANKWKIPVKILNLLFQSIPLQKNRKERTDFFHTLQKSRAELYCNALSRHFIYLLLTVS